MTSIASEFQPPNDRMHRIKPRKKLPISSQVMSGLMAFLDSATIIGTGAILYFSLVFHNNEIFGLYSSTVSFIWISTLLLFHFGGLYQFDAIIKPLAVADKLVVAFVTSFLFLFAAAFSLKVSGTLSRIWIGSFALGACGATLLMRLIVSRVVAHLSDQEVFTRNLVIVGGGEQSARLLSHLRQYQPRFVSVLGVFTDRSGAAEEEVSGYPVLGNLADLTPFIRQGRVDDVVLALPWAAEDQVLSLMDRLRELPVNIYLGADLVGFRLHFREPPSHFGTMPILEVMGRPISGWGMVAKTVEDYTLGLLFTILFLPLMAVIAIAIKLDSPGPVLFRQKRFGFNNRTFDIYKFRTMTHGCEAGHAGTPQARRRDPRVTRVGRILRRFSLDELPQLFNVLNGTMSLIGPRPHAVDHNEEYSRKIGGYFARHRVRPGMTGWAQVNGLRGETDSDEKMEARVRHDLYYAENWSVLFDFRILAMTVVICLTGRNAY